MKRNKYQTESKKIVFNKIKQFDKQFTIKDIKTSIEKDNNHVGLTTIYRIIDEMVNVGTLKKFFNESNTSYFEYLKNCHNNNHFYLKCTKCGKTKHIDCDCINEFSSHISKKHNFNINDNNLFIIGLCDKCKNK